MSNTIALNRDELVTQNLGLVHACANRFKGRGVEYEELYQAGCVGLIKAAKGFDSTLGFCFSTYAVPAILGEIRRIFRDGGSVKIGRSAKEKARKLLSVRDELSEELNREPGIQEIAERVGMNPAEAAAVLCASLPTVSLTSEEDDGQCDIPTLPPDEGIGERLDLEKAIGCLTETEQSMIRLRYFGGLTQTVTAKQLGMTQVQVSRKEKQILCKLRKMLE